VNARIPEFPTRPHGDMPFTVPLGRLVEDYERHLRVVVVDRIAPVDPTADELFRHAIAALAVLHTVTDRLFQARWLTVRERTRGPGGCTPWRSTAPSTGQCNSAALSSYESGRTRRSLRTTLTTRDVCCDPSTRRLSRRVTLSTRSATATCLTCWTTRSISSYTSVHSPTLALEFCGR
jgi:hypothetical protein